MRWPDVSSGVRSECPSSMFCGGGADNVDHPPLLSRPNIRRGAPSPGSKSDHSLEQIQRVSDLFLIIFSSASATTHLARATASLGPKARGPLQQGLCPREIAELSHRDAAKRQRRRVVAQGNPVQCSEGGHRLRARAPRR